MFEFESRPLHILYNVSQDKKKNIYSQHKHRSKHMIEGREQQTDQIYAQVIKQYLFKLLFLLLRKK